MKTKLWQLHRIAREIFSSEASLIEYAHSSSQFAKIANALENYDDLVERQDGAALDMEVGDEFVMVLLSRSNFAFYIAQPSAGEAGLTIRAYKRSASDKKIGALEAFALIGGSALEEVFEFGSFTKRS